MFFVLDFFIHCSILHFFSNLTIFFVLKDGPFVPEQYHPGRKSSHSTSGGVGGKGRPPVAIATAGEAAGAGILDSRASAATPSGSSPPPPPFIPATPTRSSMAGAGKRAGDGREQQTGEDGPLTSGEGAGCADAQQDEEKALEVTDYK